MAESYDDTGDLLSNHEDGPDDFRWNTARNSCTISVKSDENDEEADTKISEKANEYLLALLAEKEAMNHQHPIAERLLDQEINKVQTTGRIPHHDAKFVDIYREKRIRVVVDVLVPVKEHPKFNFVGKLLGPKGNSMKRLKQETMCRMAVMGRGSMRDRKKEEELRQSSEPKYAHLKEDLHVKISALAPPAEAHARVAYALAEVRKYLIPDSNDCIHQEQMRELVADGTIVLDETEPPGMAPYSKYHSKPPGPRQRGGPSGGGDYAPPSRTYPPHGYGPSRTPHLAGPPPPRSPIGGSRPTMPPAKQKVMTILDRARNAMEESYVYEEAGGYESHPPAPSHYDAYPSYGHPSSGPPSGRHHHQPPHHQPQQQAHHYGSGGPEYRRDFYCRDTGFIGTTKPNGPMPYNHHRPDRLMAELRPNGHSLMEIPLSFVPQRLDRVPPWMLRHNRHNRIC